MSHWLTNRGKYILIQGGWEDAAATAFKIELLQGASTPAAIDTEAEIQDLNTFGELLALSGVARPTGGWYVRKDLSRVAALEDDTDNRVEMDTANVVWTAATAGETIYGAFWGDCTTDTNDTTRLLMGLILFTPVPLNGSDLTLTVNDLIRAV